MVGVYVEWLQDFTCEIQPDLLPGTADVAEKRRSAGLQVADHFNAEVVAGTIGSKQDALDYLTWTFFYRRVLQNPSYYDLDDTDPDSVSAFLSDMVERNLSLLQVRPDQAGCADLSGAGPGWPGPPQMPHGWPTPHWVCRMCAA